MTRPYKKRHLKDERDFVSKEVFEFEYLTEAIQNQDLEKVNQFLNQDPEKVEDTYEVWGDETNELILEHNIDITLEQFEKLCIYGLFYYSECYDSMTKMFKHMLRHGHSIHTLYNQFDECGIPEDACNLFHAMGVRMDLETAY